MSRSIVPQQPAAESAKPRRLEIDVWKAYGTLAVVLIHSLRPYWDPHVSEVELWIGRLTRFAVPAFLAASGFLQATSMPVPLATTGRRLRRLLVPYLVASIAVQIFSYLRGEATPGGSWTVDLLLASSFGPYYYVLIAVAFSLLAPALARLPRWAIGTLLVAAIAVQWTLETAALGVVPIFWHIRNPFLWLAYYLAGWWLRLHDERASHWVRERRGVLLAVLASLVVALASVLRGSFGFVGMQTFTWVTIYPILALLYVASTGREGGPRWVAWLSDASYTVYLFHLFFVLPAAQWIPVAFGRFNAFAVVGPWIAGLVGSCLVVVVGRRILGARSRAILGA